MMWRARIGPRVLCLTPVLYTVHCVARKTPNKEVPYFGNTAQCLLEVFLFILLFIKNKIRGRTAVSLWYEHTWWKLCGEGVSSQCLHHGGSYRCVLQPGFIEDWPGIQIPHFKVIHAHTHTHTNRAHDTSTQIKDGGETQLTELLLSSETHEEAHDTKTTKLEQICPLRRDGNIWARKQKS